MINSKLIQILTALKPSEIAKFLDFVKSPYFNKKEQLYSMSAFLSKAYPAFNEEEVNKQRLFEHIFPGMAYDEKKLGYMQSELTKLALKFISIEHKEATPFDCSLVSELAERKLHKLYKKEISRLKVDLDKSQNKGANRYRLNFEVFDIEDRYFITKNERKDDENAHLASENLDLFFICKKLQYYTVLLNRNQIFGEAVQLPNMDFVLGFAQANFSTNPIVSAYYEIIMMQTKQSKENSLPHFYLSLIHI